MKLGASNLELPPHETGVDGRRKLVGELRVKAGPKSAGAVWQVFRAFLWLGLTSFGGPVAHIGYFRREFVVRRGWLTEDSYAAWVGLCQFLPGPASSQLGFCIGMLRAGVAGAIGAFVGFTLPSALMMAGLGILLGGPGAGGIDGVVHGLKLVAVAVVGQGVWAMGRRLCPDPTRWVLAAGVAAGSLLLKPAWVQPMLVVVSALVGWKLCPGTESAGVEAGAVPYGRRGGVWCLGLFGGLVFGLPWVASGVGGSLEPASGFVRAGAMVFGGGHVVLPLLEEAVVQPGWIRRDEFLTGYGAAQAVPGPMFTLAAFLGALMPGTSGGWFGALVGVLSIFAPGLLLVAGVLPFWHRLGRDSSMTRMMSGVNAGVVGLLAAALVDPVWIGAVQRWPDAVVALAGLAALLWGRVPVIAVVGGCVAAGWITRG